jgi:uncharacterized membrane protein
MRKLKSVLMWLLAIFFISAGVNHFVNPGFYLKIMPPYLPWHLALIYISGLAELVLGIILPIPKLRILAGWGIIALLIAVFPANIHMALNPELFSDINPIALWIRLPLQGVLIAWAYWYTRTDAVAEKVTSKA